MCQCIIPCFEGLLPEVHDNAISTLLFVAAYWHALAKMRMHTDMSLRLFDDTTATLGYELRRFATVTCSAFATRETQSEYDARKRAEVRRAALSDQSSSAPLRSNTLQPVAGRRPRGFNLHTIKLHFLGDYVASVRKTGTTDLYTSQTVSPHLWILCLCPYKSIARGSTNIGG